MDQFYKKYASDDARIWTTESYTQTPKRSITWSHISCSICKTKLCVMCNKHKNISLLFILLLTNVQNCYGFHIFDESYASIRILFESVGACIDD